MCIGYVVVSCFSLCCSDIWRALMSLVQWRGSVAHLPVQPLLHLTMISKGIGMEVEQPKVSKGLLKGNIHPTHPISIQKVRDREADSYNQSLLVFLKYQLMSVYVLCVAVQNWSLLFSLDIAETHVVTEGSKVVPAAPGHPLTPLALHCKAESVVSATSQCSFSSTIVHVGDKKPPESGLNTFSRLFLSSTLYMVCLIFH